MNKHKIGRPTGCKKDSVIKARVDNKTIEKLNSCSISTNLSKSEIVRMGIEKVYNDILGVKEE